MVVAIYALFPQIGAMVLHISLEQTVQASCACAQIEALGEGNRWLYLDDAGDLSERGRNTANLNSDGGALFDISSQIDVIKVVLTMGELVLDAKKKTFLFA